MGKFAIVLGTIFLAILGWHLSHMIPMSGFFAKLEPQLVEQCRAVNVAPGTEDVTIDTDLGLAFVATANRRAWYHGDVNDSALDGNGIYTLSLDGTDAVRKVSPDIDGFLPHGISLWRAGNERRLFVVSHPPDGREVVEIFNVANDGALTHLESVSFPEMFSPNDIVAVGPRSFYATNDIKNDTGLMGWLEVNMALPFSSVAYFDNGKGSVAKDGFVYANGINVSHDGKTIYIAEVTKRRISAFSIDPANGALARERVFKVDTGPDNIEIAPDGSIWTAGHPRALDFLAHAKDETVIAPSQAIRIDPVTGDANDIFVSLDGEINGSSVAAASDDTLIIGAVFDAHVMVCPLH